MAVIPLDLLVLRAGSVAEHLGFVALHDAAVATKGADGIMGGHMVALHVVRWRLDLVRSTQDADLGVRPVVVQTPQLVDRLISMGYSKTAGNRFEKPVPEVGTETADPPRAVIDILVPAYTSRPQANRRFGDHLATTEVPGLAAAFKRSPTVAAIDDNVGRLLDYLDETSLAENTIVVYTSDQGFFLGDHGWFDKRLMYEESLAMPLLIRYPPATGAGGEHCDAIVTNVDFAPTLLDLLGVEVPDDVQGLSFAPLLAGDDIEDWPDAMYYRYWMHNDGAHHCPAHYGIRTKQHKLICYYNDPLDQLGAHGPSEAIEWELFDLVADPLEVHNVIDDPAYAATVESLRAELLALQERVGDQPYAGLVAD